MTIEHVHTFHVFPIHYLLRYTLIIDSIDIDIDSIVDSNILTECNWCAAGDLAGCNIFSNDLEG